MIVLALAVLWAARPVRPARAATVAAAALLALGAWSGASPLWDGVPAEAWKGFNRSAIAAAALLLGGVIAAGSQRCRNLVFGGVLMATALQAGEILLRAGVQQVPTAWLEGRLLEGPMGYHNAQAGFLVLGLPVAIWAAGAGAAPLRALGGLSAGLLAGATLLCQSRGALIALTFAVALQLVWARTLRAAVGGLTVAASFAVLSVPLEQVDAALIEGTPITAADTLRKYALATLLVSVVAAALSTVPLRSERTRRYVAAISLTVAVAGTAVIVTARPALRSPTDVVSQLASDAPPDTPAGATRLATLSLNGRRDAWRVALDMGAEKPLAGGGQGSFARRWTVDRRLERLYILQPHSLELELLAELGAIGLALFAIFAGSAAIVVLRSPRRPAAAAAAAVLALLLVQSAVDWTWHFAALVVPALLVAGATAGARRVESAGFWPRAAPLLPLPLLVPLLLAPALAERHVTKARAAAKSDAADLRYHALAAQKLEPWNPDAVSLEALGLENAGRYRLAAIRYERAAQLSQRPWLERYRQARALTSAGLSAGAAAACSEAFAANPAEPRLRSGPCEGF